ncbi:uncharacterized protein KY384_001310 [Bacidia gigantensis]|uniref:uncharacterized protein n=1 Tax=Bacidia gigantensis TaxID=2732470 RepID=UPI001D050F93|nr:uncharacterized protein KY384_001310 [Bacidia gigantensis]KAG8533570.1 hypothetical protein KY384_001310 [Bacidia gigantensis]
MPAASFLSLSPELRNNVYDYLIDTDQFIPLTNGIPGIHTGPGPEQNLFLLQSSNAQIAEEARSFYFSHPRYSVLARNLDRTTWRYRLIEGHHIDIRPYIGKMMVTISEDEFQTPERLMPWFRQLDAIPALKQLQIRCILHASSLRQCQVLCVLKSLCDATKASADRLGKDFSFKVSVTCRTCDATHLGPMFERHRSYDEFKTATEDLSHWTAEPMDGRLTCERCQEHVKSTGAPRQSAVGPTHVSVTKQALGGFLGEEGMKQLAKDWVC